MSVTRRELLTAVSAALTSAPGRQGRHYVYDFAGTPFEIGLQHGKALSREIRAEAQPAAEAMARKWGTTVETAVARTLSRYEALYREHVPAALEEIRGIAQGAGLSYAYSFFAAARDMMRTGECTALVCTGKQARGGQVLIGQTKDTGSGLDRFRIMRLAYRSGRRLIVLNYPGWIGNLCLTSDGLSFTGNSLFASSPNSPTVPGSLLKRLIMEKRSTREVLDAIQGMSFENGCLLVADRSGQAVCLEMAAGRTEAREVSGEAFGHANDILLPALKGFESVRRSASSPLRQKNIDRLLREHAGRITVPSLERMLRDHTDFPLSICRHPSERDSGTTNAAFIADLTAGQMHIAIGNPCVAPFKRYDLSF